MEEKEDEERKKKEKKKHGWSARPFRFLFTLVSVYCISFLTLMLSIIISITTHYQNIFYRVLVYY